MARIVVPPKTVIIDSNEAAIHDGHAASKPITTPIFPTKPDLKMEDAHLNEYNAALTFSHRRDGSKVIKRRFMGVISAPIPKLGKIYISSLGVVPISPQHPTKSIENLDTPYKSLKFVSNCIDNNPEY